MKKLVQKALHCRCGREKVLAHGLCATCYTLKRQDEEYFGGLREQVLKRDGYHCRVCNAAGRGKRSIVVHHRRPGRSLMHLMISLCPACHAIVTRTRVVRRAMSPLLLELWQEQHPDGQVQSILEFAPLAHADPARVVFSASAEEDQGRRLSPRTKAANGTARRTMPGESYGFRSLNPVSSLELRRGTVQSG